MEVFIMCFSALVGSGVVSVFFLAYEFVVRKRPMHIHEWSMWECKNIAVLTERLRRDGIVRTLRRIARPRPRNGVEAVQALLIDVAVPGSQSSATIAGRGRVLSEYTTSLPAEDGHKPEQSYGGERYTKYCKENGDW